MAKALPIKLTADGADFAVSKGVTVAVRVEDVDGDGDADVTLYVNGVRFGTIQFSTLAGNVAAEAKRVGKRIRKAVKK